MRQFVVMGYATNNTRETGKVLFAGPDNDQAIAALNAGGTQIARTELFELAVPRQRRHFERENVSTKDTKSTKEEKAQSTKKK